jgi:hypothetical protein
VEKRYNLYYGEASVPVISNVTQERLLDRIDYMIKYGAKRIKYRIMEIAEIPVTIVTKQVTTLERKED